MKLNEVMGTNEIPPYEAAEIWEFLQSELDVEHVFDLMAANTIDGAINWHAVERQLDHHEPLHDDEKAVLADVMRHKRGG